MNDTEANLVSRIFLVEKSEYKVTGVSFLLAFLLMLSYYILRPVRDGMASDWSDLEVSFMWNINFFISAALVAIYGFAASKINIKFLVPSVYTLFSASFIAYYFGSILVADHALLDKMFYIWVSVFSLFHVSVFWSLMSDTFNKEQAKRLFAIIAAGASLGAISGSGFTTLFAQALGVDMLMLIASCGLLIVVPLTFYIYRLKSIALHNEDITDELNMAKLGGHWWHGFKTVTTSPYLMSIVIFLILYTFVASFIYFEQKNLLAEYTRAERTQILGGIDWIVNTLTFYVAFFGTSRIVRRFGMPITLALLPGIIAVALLILAFAPMLTVLLALQVARRSGNYAITRPAREMLFTEVSQEERFKAKPVIDVVLYRGGDALSSLAFAGLTQGLGLGLAAVALVGAGIASLWAWAGIRLGRKYERRMTSRE